MQHQALAIEHPEILTEWDYSNQESPLILTSGSGKKVGWVCALGHHSLSGDGGRLAIEKGSGS